MARVLVIDDELSVGTVVSKVLEVAAHRVRVVLTGAEATAALQSGPWDVVLIDKHLPDMPGPQLISLVRSSQPEAAVVMMTGNPDRAATRTLDLDGYLPKPFRSLDSIRAVVAEAVDRRKRTREREAMAATLKAAVATSHRND